MDHALFFFLTCLTFPISKPDNIKAQHCFNVLERWNQLKSIKNKGPYYPEHISSKLMAQQYIQRKNYHTKFQVNKSRTEQ
eukprot:c966_g1_i1 orf=74-313(+)